MSDTSQQAKNLIALLKEQFRIQEEIYEVAEVIHECAVGKNIEKLSSSVQRQDNLIQKMDRADKKRRVLVEEITGNKADAITLTAVLPCVPEIYRDEISRLRKKLKDILHTNRSISKENEVIIKTKLAVVKEDIQMITGMNREDSGYNQKREKSMYNRNIVNRKI
ncbi:MAG: flagellar protein FlgN [Fibrobacterota bacterium]